MKRVAIVGCGFVADLYMRSFAAHPEIEVVSCYDRDEARLEAFSKYWNVTAAADLETVFTEIADTGLILNLTNPRSHYDVNKGALEAGCHVFCEKPLAMSYEDAQSLHAMARARGLQLGSAPPLCLERRRKRWQRRCAAETMARHGLSMQNLMTGLSRRPHWKTGKAKAARLGPMLTNSRSAALWNMQAITLAG